MTRLRLPVFSVLGALLAVMCVALSVDAQTLYKYLDKDGKVVYSDKPPKDGPSTKLEVDPDTNPMKGPQQFRPAPESAKPSTRGMMETRIALRDKLRARVDAAEDKLAAAKKALQDGLDPREDEWQPTYSAPDNGGKPNKAGVITGRGGRVACGKTQAPDGSERVACPALMVPSEAYHERIKELENAVARAEEVLAAAQSEYRRNAPD